MVRPVFDGIETYTQIRDASAPEDYSWSIDSLSPGQMLQLTPDGGAEVVGGDGTVIASIGPPTAHDANGTSVPASFAVTGNVLTMHVAHLGGNYAYPIVADPHWVWRAGGCLSEGHTRTIVHDLRTGATVGEALSQIPIPGPVAFAIERGVQVLSIGAVGFAEHMAGVDRSGGHPAYASTPGSNAGTTGIRSRTRRSASLPGKLRTGRRAVARHRPPLLMSKVTTLIDRLAEALIERLMPLLPSGFSLEHPPGSITIIMIRPGRFCADGLLLVLRLPIPRRIKLTLATDDVLTAVQQFVEDGTGEAWPPAAQERAGKPAARAHVAVKGGQIHVGFGDADAPMLALAPINLTDLEG